MERRAFWIVIAVVAALGALLLWQPSTGSSAQAPTDRESVTQRAGEDAQLYVDGNYAAVYRRLSRPDRERISLADWVSRCKFVEESMGKMTEYKVTELKYLDSDKQVVEVTLVTQWENASGPQVTTTYYVRQGDGHAQSMMWGRELTLDPSDVQ